MIHKELHIYFNSESRNGSVYGTRTVKDYNGVILYESTYRMHSKASAEDPVSILEKFITPDPSLPKEAQCCCHVCRDSCDSFNPGRKPGINITGKLHQFIIKLFKIRS